MDNIGKDKQGANNEIGVSGGYNNNESGLNSIGNNFINSCNLNNPNGGNNNNSRSAAHSFINS